MWVIEKMRESVESIPLELSRYMRKSKEDINPSSKPSLFHNLPNNILTPDKIPEFCLPPRLYKRNQLIEAKTSLPDRYCQIPKSSISLNTTYGKQEDMKKNADESVPVTSAKKFLPFSAEAYGLAGIYESPNTRRKESLFHSRRPVYIVDRKNVSPTLKPVEEKNQLKRTLPGFLPLFLCKSMSETRSSESETFSSSDSSPLKYPYTIKSSKYRYRLKGATSCPSLIDNREDRRKWREKRDAFSLTTSPRSSPSPEGSSLTSPSVLFPLQGEKKRQQEHIFMLQGRGKVRLLAELITFPINTNSACCTVRIHVMSVKEICNDTKRQAPDCALVLYLTPGMLQTQESATIRNCSSPVFNEDFFFAELRREDLGKLQLRLKLVNKPTAAGLRVTVIGVITKPLSQLLHLTS